MPDKKVLTQSNTQAKEEHKSLQHLEPFHFSKPLRMSEHDAVAKGPKFRKNCDVKSKSHDKHEPSTHSATRLGGSKNSRRPITGKPETFRLALRAHFNI